MDLRDTVCEDRTWVDRVRQRTSVFAVLSLRILRPEKLN